jgi:signal peptidase II
VTASFRFTPAFAGLFGAMALDVLSKWVIVNVVMAPPRLIEIAPFFNLTLGFNTGISFGFLQGVIAERPLLLVGASAIITVGLLVLAARVESRLDRFCLGLIAGGAAGNLIDRARHGAVTDSLDFHWAGWHWPTFNLADAAITLGVLMLIIGALLPSRSGPVLARPQDDRT